MAERAKELRYRLEAMGAVIVYASFRLLPPDAASGLGGWLGRTIGPRLAITRKARGNLNRVMPELDAATVERIVGDMWENLGRVVGEFPHLERIASDPRRVEIAGEANIETLRGDGRPCILFSGHLANWEVFALTCRRAGMGYVQVYRAANNPFVDAMVRRVRGLADEDIAPKGPRGARGAISALKAGRRLGMLVDQKMNDGIAVPFFGLEAMTPQAAAVLALRFGCPLVPVRLERLGGCRFRLTFHEPVALDETGDRPRDVLAVMTEVNRILESWIRERPGQWFWLHRRWPDS